MAFGVEQNEKASGLMVPHHHVDEDMLLSYAAGTLAQAPSIIVAAHLVLCPHCRSAVKTAEAVGGALLDDIAPEPVAQKNIDAVMARLDDIVPELRRAASQKPQTLFGAVLPQPILDHLPDELTWCWISPGVKFADMLTDDTGARIGLMRTQAKASITPHGHSGDEMTLVLHGGYRDAATGFRRGDVQTVDETVTHELVTDADGECLSLVMIRGPIKPTRWIARIFRHFTGF